jgi:hypothetical protein
MIKTAKKKKTVRGKYSRGILKLADKVKIL